MRTNFLLFGIISVVISGYVEAQSDLENYSQKTLLKNWALSHCLAQVYADASIKADANATASAYLEFGNQPLDAYEKLSLLAKKYSGQKLIGSVKSDFNTMKCINMLNSKELDQLTGSLSKTK